jgi:zinc/manganese transport system permease protein
VDADQLVPVALLYALILCAWFGLGGVRRPALFYTLFALAITASVQLVGVYLVFASLIIPALSVRRLGTYALVPAYLLGAAGYAAGLVVSALLDLPSGAVIVWMLALLALAWALLVTRFRCAPPGGRRHCASSGAPGRATGPDSPKTV